MRAPLGVPAVPVDGVLWVFVGLEVLEKLADAVAGYSEVWHDGVPSLLNCYSSRQRSCSLLTSVIDHQWGVAGEN